MSEKLQQNSALSLLKRQIECGMLPQAYLFSGNDEKAKDEAVHLLATYFLGENYAHSPDFFKTEEDPITIEEVRMLKIKSSQSAVSGRKNVFLIKNIENLSREASPAMLKLLEEPSINSIIIATTKNKSFLLSTIKSRFSVFRFWTTEPETVKSEDELKTKLIKSLAGAEISARKNPNHANILKFEKILEIHKIINDPTVNKRLLGEYLNLIS